MHLYMISQNRKGKHHPLKDEKVGCEVCLCYRLYHIQPTLWKIKTVGEKKKKKENQNNNNK